MVATGDSLWVTSSSGVLTRINPFNRTVSHVYRLGYEATGITVYNEHIWIGIGAPVQQS